MRFLDLRCLLTSVTLHVQAATGVQESVSDNLLLKQAVLRARSATRQTADLDVTADLPGFVL